MLNVPVYNLTLMPNTLQTSLVREKFVLCDVLFDSPDKIVSAINMFFSLHSMAEEYVYMACMNSAMIPIALMEVSHGTVNSAIAGVREIIIRALCVGAVSIVIIHNHPSSQRNPSVEDRMAFKKIHDGCNYVGLNLTDFIIIAGDSWFSFKNEGEYDSL